MSKIRGPVLVVIILALVAGAIVFLKPILFDRQQRSTSNSSASSEVMRFGGDEYHGYWFINSPDMRQFAPRQGIEIDFTDDGGAYAERLKKFDDGDYDCIVLPINSYLEHGAKYRFPGVVVAAVAESQGADAIVGFADLMPSGKINELNDASLRFVYTGASPTSFLQDLIISDFALDQLQTTNDWRHEVGSPEEVYNLAKKATSDRSVGDVFGLWEPWVSKAEEKLGLKVLWSSEKFSGYIVDVFVFHRDFVKHKPELVQKFLSTYFRVLNRYASDKDRMIKEMTKTTDLNKASVTEICGKINWFDLQENCAQQFGVSLGPSVPSNDRIISSIISCSDVMERAGYFDTDDLRDPYRIVNNSFLEVLVQSELQNVGTSQAVVIDFSPLDSTGWIALKEAGTMAIKPITFQSGNNRLDETGKSIVDKMANMLVNNYPTYRVSIRGHTGPGDEQANAQLSLERAQVLKQYLIAVYGVDEDRLQALGLGATQPPKRQSGESTRSFRIRMPRVEFVLLEGDML
jgi:outer membrane protein OmpA-like peptidoglycan-associated protein